MGAFQTDIQVFVDAMGPAAAEMLRQAAQDEEDKVEADQSSRRGIRPFTHIAVDGIAVTGFQSVKATSIVFEYWDYRAEIIKACFEELRHRSPVQSGTYRDSFYASLDGQDLEPLVVPQPAQLANVTEVIITNPVPYARRLEVGLTKSGAAFVKQVDPHIVESAMQVVRKEFGSVAKFDFAFVDRVAGYRNRTAFGSRHGRRSRGVGSAVRYPAILIHLA